MSVSNLCSYFSLSRAAFYKRHKRLPEKQRVLSEKRRTVMTELRAIVAL